MNQRTPKTYEIHACFPNDGSKETLCARTDTHKQAQAIVDAMRSVWGKTSGFTIRRAP
jgi:hypothetical protein